jgi:hypothetical protein
MIAIPPRFAKKLPVNPAAQRRNRFTTFADLVQEARERVKRDAVDVKMKDDGRGFEPGLQALMRFRLILPWTLGGARIIGHRSRLGEEISLFRRSVDRRFQWFGIMPKATYSRFHRELGRGNRLDHKGKRCRTPWSRARNGKTN